MVKKSITVTDKQNKWIQAQMATGNYGTDSEVIREALRDKQAATAQIVAIRNKLIKAEQSGFTNNTHDEILKEIKDELRKNGEL